jgi:hypothetical protein
MSLFLCIGLIKGSIQVQGTCMFCNYASFYGKELLAPRPSPKLEDHPLLVVHGCLFNIFAATLQIGGCSSIRNLKTPCHGDGDTLIMDTVEHNNIKRIMLL